MSQNGKTSSKKTTDEVNKSLSYIFRLGYVCIICLESSTHDNCYNSNANVRSNGADVLSLCKYWHT